VGWSGPGGFSFAMPDPMSVAEFVTYSREDYNSPTTSSFTTKMGICRNHVGVLEDVSFMYSSVCVCVCVCVFMTDCVCVCVFMTDCVCVCL